MSLSWADPGRTSRLYLGPGQVVLRSGAAIHSAVPATPDWAGALAAVQSLLREQRPTGRVAVALSSQFAPLWLLPAPPTRLNFAETRGWVAAQVAERFGDLAAGWRLCFRPAPVGVPIMASGIDSAHWAELLHALTEARLTATQVAPWPALALAHRGRLGNARLALLETGRLTLASLAGGEVVVLGTSSFGEPTQLLDLTARAALVDHLGDVPLHLFATGIAGDWGTARVIANTPEAALTGGHCELDFLASRPRRPYAAWLLLAAGVVLASLAGQRYATLSAQQTALAPPAAGVSAPSRKTGTAPADTSAPARAWDELLNRLEDLHGPEIALLSLHADARRGEAKLTAEARHTADMLTWLGVLRSSGFPDASLLRHAVQDEDPQLPVKFEIQLHWGKP